MALKTWLRELTVGETIYRIVTDHDRWKLLVYHPHVGWAEPVEFPTLKAALAHVRTETGLTPR